MDCFTVTTPGSHGAKWLAAALCGASFAVGQLVFGQMPAGIAPPLLTPAGTVPAEIAPRGTASVALEKAAEGNQPRTILNDYLSAKAATSGRGEPADANAATSGRGEPSLKPAAIQAVAELPLDPATIEARPQPVAAPSAGTKPGSAAALQFETNPFVAGKSPHENKPLTDLKPLVEAKPLAAEDSLPPIVPAWALPKPTKAATSGRGPHESTKAATSGRGPQQPDARSQDRVAARPVSASSPAQNSEFRIQNSAPQSPIPNPSAVQPVDYETRGLAFQPAPRMLPAEPADNEAQFGQLPEGSPFEAIQQSGTIKLRVRRSILLRTKVDVYRTAIVDEAVCDIVQFTPREVSIIGRSLGQTHVTFWFDDPAMAPLTYLVEVKPDAEQVKADEDKYQLLENVINEMFPDSKIHLVLVADKLLVKGQAKDSEEAAQIMTIVRAQSGVRGGGGPGGIGGGYGIAEGAATPVLSLQATGGNPGPQYQIINMLRVPGVQQVALKVKIAELNRSAARGFGVDVNAAINFSDSVEGSKLFLSSLLNAGNTGGTSLLTSFSGDDVSVGIRYLQERGVIRLLSEPTLVTLSGRPATFIAGGEFAVPTIVGSVGLNAVTTDFRAFGAIISFLPTVVDKDRVRLQVAPEFSQINNQLRVNNTPGLNVRAATTTVEMREGQTLAIAGLLEDTYKATNVGDLPGLAQIFGRRDSTRSETELIILVSPELVHPMEAEEVPPLPGFDVTEPTACQFFLHGDIEGNPTQDYRSTVWPRLRKRYGMGGSAMTSGPFGHGQ